MFARQHGATATYRTLARGFGSGWVRTYQASQHGRPAHRDPRQQAHGTAPRGRTGEPVTPRSRA
jgi:hypothetical protein